MGSKWSPHLSVANNSSERLRWTSSSQHTVSTIKYFIQLLFSSCCGFCFHIPLQATSNLIYTEPGNTLLNFHSFDFFFFLIAYSLSYNYKTVIINAVSNHTRVHVFWLFFFFSYYSTSFTLLSPILLLWFSYYFFLTHLGVVFPSLAFLWHIFPSFVIFLTLAFHTVPVCL